MRFTIKEFRKAYPTDDVCIEKVWQLRYGNLKNCLKCGETTTFHRVQTTSYIKREKRKCYSCAKCGYQIYPLAGTIFEKTRTPLSSWFYIIYLFTTTRNGVAAKEIERQLGVTYKCAFRMGHLIRQLMASKETELLSGVVQMDETYVGGLVANFSKYKRLQIKKEGKVYAGGNHKTPLFGMVDRNGRVRVKAFSNSNEINAENLEPIIKQYTQKDSIVVTDYHGAYKSLKNTFKLHYKVNHMSNEYCRDGFHTNTIEGFWSQLKRTIKGTHIFVSPKYLENYAREVAFRYENRNLQPLMFELIIAKV